MTRTIEGVHQVCLGGLGIALLSHWMAREGLASVALEEARLSDAAPEMLTIYNASVRLLTPRPARAP